MQRTHELERADHAWFSNLVRELFQTEQSAKDHPIIEAERLGDVPPALVLRAVAAHAEEALAELPPLVTRHDLPVSEGGKTVGAAFSAIRDHFADLLLNAEKSYRGTLLGMRHGVDLVELIHYVALEDGDESLAAWCTTWLERRRPLVEAAARELSWFAKHPSHARQPAKPSVFSLGLHVLIAGVEQLTERVRQAVPGAVEQFNELTEKVRQAVPGAVEQLGELTEKVRQAVPATVEQLTEKVRQVLPRKDAPAGEVTQGADDASAKPET